MKLILLTALIAAPTAMVSAPSAQAVDFRTPNKAAYCDFELQGEVVEGGVPKPRTEGMFCWAPHDGFTVQMTVRGRAQRSPAVAATSKAPMRRSGASCDSVSDGGEADSPA